MQLAVAIEILLKAPMRSINLIGLRLDRHILRPRGPGGVVHVRLDATETKAKRAQEFELAGESRILFDRYLAAFRPILADVDCPFLFPGADRRTAKAQSTLAKQIVDAIARHVGIHMTIHQFRHFCAALLLERDPANVHVVKTLLGVQRQQELPSWRHEERTPVGLMSFTSPPGRTPERPSAEGRSGVSRAGGSFRRGW
jgi:integrase